MLQKQPFIKKFIRFFPVFFLLLICFKAEAKTYIYLHSDAQKNGYTFSSKNGKFKIGVQPGSLSKHDSIKLTIGTKKKSKFTLPSDHNLISKIYSYSFTSTKKVKAVKPLWISINYGKDNGGGKSIKYWYQNTKKWRNLASEDSENIKIIRSSILRRKAIVAVFQEKHDYETGLASWYDWDGAAHRTYPFGTIVKVTNLANNKSCEVTINDRGPFIEGRIIDLSRDAFASIADLGAGVVEVKVEPLYIP